MKKKLLILLAAVSILTLATACGGPVSGAGSDGGASNVQQQESGTLTGKLDEKKDFMFVVTDDDDVSYQFSIDSSAAPEGYDDVAEGDSVTVTYTGTLSEVDPFEGTVISVEKAN